MNTSYSPPNRMLMGYILSVINKYAYMHPIKAKKEKNQNLLILKYYLVGNAI